MGVEEVEGKRCLEPCGRQEARRVEDQGVKRPIRGRGGLGQRCGQIGEWVRMQAVWLFRGEYNGFSGVNTSPGSKFTHRMQEN